MIAWQKQGDAVIGVVSLRDGRGANAAIVGGRANPKGAVIIAVAASGAPEALPLGEALELLTPDFVVDIVCMQERLHGEHGLERPIF